MKATIILPCLLAALVTSASAGETNFLRSGLIIESDVTASLADELLSAGDLPISSSARQHLEQLRKDIRPMYTSLPKNSEGKLNHQVVRYALHRFFVHRHGWFIRGLEPNNDTWHGAADPNSHNSSAMQEWVPSYMQDILEQRLGREGTDLNQLAALAAALDDVIQKESKGRLETIYNMYENPLDKLLSQTEVKEMILTYFVGVLNSGDLDFTATTREKAKERTDEFFHTYTGWTAAHQWIEELMSKHLLAKANGKFDFQSVNHLVDKIGEEYYTLNDKECDDLKVTLRKMQGKKPGRVRLSAFYNKGMYSHWDFSEKRSYLSSLGVLDETDPNSPSVIIANYAMSRPNCLDSSNIYTICCRNECEDLMGRLESEFGSAMVDPTRLAKLISAMPSATMDSDWTLPQDLLDRLDGIARRHGGEVPLHGRLFAQWMHHAYPLECPYPHEMGSINPLTRGEWLKETGHETEKASTEEMMDHIASDTCAIDPTGSIKCADETAELPWNDNEELLTWRPRSVGTNIGTSVSTQRQCSPSTAFIACVLAMVGLLAAVRKRGSDVAWRPLAVTVLLGMAAFAVGLVDGTLLVIVLGVGCVVVVSNHVTAGSSPKGVTDSKECV